jgi:DNA-binding LytR/AlgR family response regulator
MSKVTIGVVENEMVIADTICLTLRKLGYEVFPPAPNYNRAVIMIEEHKPDLLLLDINLGGQKDGIDLAYFVREHYTTPIIFLTANSDKATIDRAKPVKPNAYLVKPFTKEDLYSAIEIAVSNYFDADQQEKKEENALFIKDGYNFSKVYFKEMMYLMSEHNYVTFHLANGKKLMMRSTLQEMMNKLPNDSFVRINRGTVININYITTVGTDKIYIEEESFPITKISHDEVVEKLTGKTK